MMHGVDEYFKEYKIERVSKELTKLKDLLKEDSRCEASAEEIKTLKAIDNQHSKLMKFEEII